ncbi:MAG: ECF-type sigma factor [Panacagrimonas sp.]
MGDITLLLNSARAGDVEARDTLFKAVYAELRKLARIPLSRQSTLTDLDASGLVNEAYLRLTGRKELPGDNRRAFFSYAAAVMRSVIVDHVRERNAAKRGDGLTRITLVTGDMGQGLQAPEVGALDDALQDLRRIDERCHRVVEMRFFAGMSVDEIAQVLEVSVATVGRDWDKARAFLYRTLKS